MASQVSTNSFTNYYDVLHLSRDATKSQIRLRFKKLSLLFHPDKNSDEDASRIFRSLKTAEEILSDPNKKAQFDRQLHEIDNFLKHGNFRAAAERAKAAAERDAEDRARNHRHWEHERARQQQNHPRAGERNPNTEGSKAPPSKTSGPNFYKHPQPKWNEPKPPRVPRPRYDIHMRPHYRPSGRQPPWSTSGRTQDDSSLPWGKNPVTLGSKNPFISNPLTGEKLPVHGDFPIDPGDHWSPEIDKNWPIAHTSGYHVLRGCSELYRSQWKDVVTEAAIFDMQSDLELKEALRRIEYMFHTFATYVWNLLIDLPQNMLVIIDPEAALERLNTVIQIFAKLCQRGQRLGMALGFLAQGVRNVFEPREDEMAKVSDEAGRKAVLRQAAEIYETFMGPDRGPSPEPFT